MTDQHRDEPSTRERLTAMENGLRHFQEISVIRNERIREALTELRTHNTRQDNDLEAIEEKLLDKIEKITALLWSGMKWGAGLTVTTLFAIILKALNLI
jgi:hypothetical protein